MNERRIFMAAIDTVDADQRRAYLDEACGDDVELRRRVEALLHSHETGGSFLEKPPAELGQGTAAADSTGDTLESAEAEQCTLDFLVPTEKPGCLGTIGQYEVTEVVGRGGMGIVLKAYDPKLSRVVAVKVLAPELACNASACKRFLREGRAAAAVSHDHVVTIYGIDDGGRLPFIVMEYISGQSLQQRIDTQGALELKEILRIGKQAAAGLAAAHAEGLIHRDIKPANMLLENGVERVKITDFGLARAVDDVRITQPGVVTGTPEYMSPEQARGESVDHRSDLFSLGSVLYAMCTGRAPFRAENTVAMIRRVCDDQPRPIQQVNPEIPGWLVKVIERLLAKDPESRIRSASEVADLLGKYLAHVQQPSVIPAPPELETPTHRAFSSNQSYLRRRWLAAAAVVLVAAAGFGLSEASGVTGVTSTIIRIIRGDGTVVVEVDDPDVEVTIDGEEIVISGAGPKQIRVRPGKHEVVATRDGKTLHSELITITRGGRQVVKVSRVESAEPPKSAGRAGQPVDEGPTATTRMAWPDAVDDSGDVSPDGRYLSFVDWETGDLAVRDMVAGTNRRLTDKGSWQESSEFAESSAFSPDGNRLAYAWCNKKGAYELRVIGLGGSESRVLTEGLHLWVCDWSPDGTEILAVFTQKDLLEQIAVVSVADGATRVLKSPGRGLGEIAFSPCGEYVAYDFNQQTGAQGRDVFLLSADGEKESRLVEHPADDLFWGWAPDHQRLLFASDRSGSFDLWVIRVRDGRPQGAAALVKRDVGRVRPLGLSPQGSIYYSVEKGSSNIYLAQIDPQRGEVLDPPKAAKTRYAGFSHWPVWSPDGRYLAFSSNRRRHTGRILSIWSPETGQQREIPMEGRLRANFFGMSWSPDAREIVVRNRDREGRQGIFRIDTQTDEITPVALAEPNERLILPHWSPDGKAVFYLRGPNYGVGDPGVRFRIVRHDLDGHQEVDLYESSSRIACLSLSPDGNRLAFATLRSKTESPELTESRWEVSVMSTGGKIAGQPIPVTGIWSRWPGRFTWTPDGEYLLYGKRASDEDPQTELWRIALPSGKQEKLDLAVPGMMSISLHPDGRRLAFHAGEAWGCDVWVMEGFLPEPMQEAVAAE